MPKAKIGHFPGFNQPLKTEEMDRLQQTIAVGILIELNEGLVHQLQEVIEDGFRRDAFSSVLVEIGSKTDAFRCLKRKISDKDAKSPQDDLLWSRQKAVAPIDGGVQGLL